MNAVNRPDVLARFWSKINKTDGCWLWTGTVSGRGYGMFSALGKSMCAHRFSYEISVGPIQDGFEIDHVRARGCSSRLCVNPAHLEQVTTKTNVLRGSGPTAVNAAKSVCKRGHPLSGSNLYMRADRYERRCRMCQYLHDQKYKARARCGSEANHE